jgi:hypothetical protein
VKPASEPAAQPCDRPAAGAIPPTEENDMETLQSNELPKIATRSRKWWLIAIAVSVCALSWVALAIGLLLGVGFTPRVVLATAAALSTEALVWIVAAVLGLRAFEARQRIWQRLKSIVAR